MPIFPKMPRLPSVTEIRVSNITACLELAVVVLNELNNAFETPFVEAISNTTKSLIIALRVRHLVKFPEF